MNANLEGHAYNSKQISSEGNLKEDIENWNNTTKNYVGVNNNSKTLNLLTRGNGTEQSSKSTC